MFSWDGEQLKVKGWEKKQRPYQEMSGREEGNELQKKPWGTQEELCNSAFYMCLLNAPRIDTKQTKNTFQSTPDGHSLQNLELSTQEQIQREHRPKWTHPGTPWMSKQLPKGALNLVKESFYYKAQSSQQLQDCILLIFIYYSVYGCQFTHQQHSVAINHFVEGVLDEQGAIGNLKCYHRRRRLLGQRLLRNINHNTPRLPRWNIIKLQIDEEFAATVEVLFSFHLRRSKLVQISSVSFIFWQHPESLRIGMQHTPS